MTPSPFDAIPFPDNLTARVVTPGPRPLVQGYDVESDLARHYTFAEGILVALTGDAPDAALGRAFEVALLFLSPAPVHEAPTHASVLARLCAGSASAVLGTAAVGLAEQARSAVAGAGTFLRWLEASAKGVPPPEAMAKEDEERASVARLREALGPELARFPALSFDLGRTPALLAVLHTCGLRAPHALEAAWVVARLATAVAEAMAADALSTERRAFLRYPMQLPRFQYHEEAT